MAHPRALATYLDHLGAPAETMLRRQGLPVYGSHLDTFVPLSRAWAFFAAAARREDSMIGWHFGRYYGELNLSRAFLSRLKGAQTLYMALRRLVDFIRSEASQLELGLLERRDNVLLFTHYESLRGEPGYDVSQSYQLGVYLDLIRQFAGRQWLPDEVGIEAREAPAVAREHFPGTLVRTNQAAGYVAVPRSLLHLPPSAGEPGSQGDPPLLLASQFDFVTALESVVTAYIGEGYLPARAAAALMDTSERTLARRLAAHGLRYQEVIDQARFQRARDLLRDTVEPIKEIAAAVGFNDPAHFGRMFRRMAGLSPRAYRRVIHRGIPDATRR